jgi:hypothetical protein
MGTSDTERLDELRARIQQIEGRPAVLARWQPSGFAALDAVAGGLPRPGVVALVGSKGSGRTRLALGLAAAESQRGRVAWVDGPHELVPSTAASLGVELARLLWVKPPADRMAWTVEQVARSGCFGLVVVSLPEDPGPAGAAWARAAQLGCCTVVVVGERLPRDLPAELRLEAQGDQAVVARRRGGRLGEVVSLPAWPAGMCPWA